MITNAIHSRCVRSSANIFQVLHLSSCWFNSGLTPVNIGFETLTFLTLHWAWRKLWNNTLPLFGPSSGWIAMIFNCKMLSWLPGSFWEILLDKSPVISHDRSADIPSRKHPYEGLSLRSSRNVSRLLFVLTVCNATRGSWPPCAVLHPGIYHLCNTLLENVSNAIKSGKLNCTILIQEVFTEVDEISLISWERLKSVTHRIGKYYN